MIGPKPNNLTNEQAVQLAIDTGDRLVTVDLSEKHDMLRHVRADEILVSTVVDPVAGS